MFVLETALRAPVVGKSGGQYCIEASQLQRRGQEMHCYCSIRRNWCLTVSGRRCAILGGQNLTLYRGVSPSSTPSEAPYWHLIGGASAQGNHNHPFCSNSQLPKALPHQPNHNAICFRHSDTFHLLAAGALSITCDRIVELRPCKLGRSCHYHIEDALGSYAEQKAQAPASREIVFEHGVHGCSSDVNGKVQRYRRN